MHYSPGPIPSLDNIPLFLNQELRNIASALTSANTHGIDKTYVEPNKPYDGQIVYADGTNWNPGSGAGIYYYNGAIWKLLG